MAFELGLPSMMLPAPSCTKGNYFLLDSSRSFDRGYTGKVI